MSWYLKSARQKNSIAMFNIAVAYYNGEGVPAADNVKAYAWFLLAREAGNKLAADGMQRLETGMKLGGVDDGLLTIAEMYEKGENLDQDFAEAAKWYRKAAEKGVHPAQVKLAGMLIAGQGVTQDYREARHWCEVAAREFAAGMYCVGRIYRQGLGVTKDPKAAAKWLQRAAYYGEGNAMFELGEMYWNGVGVKRDEVRAYMWTLMAFSARIPGARENALLLKKEMNDREVDSAKKKALEFLRTRPFFRLREPVSPEANYGPGGQFLVDALHCAGRVCLAVHAMFLT